MYRAWKQLLKAYKKSLPIFATVYNANAELKPDSTSLEEILRQGHPSASAEYYNKSTGYMCNPYFTCTFRSQLVPH